MLISARRSKVNKKQGKMPHFDYGPLKKTLMVSGMKKSIRSDSKGRLLKNQKNKQNQKKVVRPFIVIIIKLILINGITNNDKSNINGVMILMMLVIIVLLLKNLTFQFHQMLFRKGVFRCVEASCLNFCRDFIP